MKATEDELDNSQEKLRSANDDLETAEKKATDVILLFFNNNIVAVCLSRLLANATLYCIRRRLLKFNRHDDGVKAMCDVMQQLFVRGHAYVEVFNSCGIRLFRLVQKTFSNVLNARWFSSIATAKH